MSKTIEVEIREGETEIEKVSRPVIKGEILYKERWYAVQPGNFIDLWADYPWEASPLDPELSRLFGWFCQNKSKIEEALDVEDLMVTDEGVFCHKKKPKATTNEALLFASIVAAGGFGGFRPSR